MTNSKTNIQSRKASSKPLSLNKRIIIRIYIIIVWFTTALLLLIMTKMIAYEDIKYFFWTESVLVPLLYVLYTIGIPDQLSGEQEKEQKKAIFVLAFSFVCMIMALFMAMFNRY